MRPPCAAPRTMSGACCSKNAASVAKLRLGALDFIQASYCDRRRNTRRSRALLLASAWLMKASSTEGARTSDWVKQGLTADLDQGELFERAFRHAAIGMALVDLDGRFLKVNDALCHTFGYSREPLLALDFQTITHPADRDADEAS